MNTTLVVADSKIKQSLSWEPYKYCKYFGGPSYYTGELAFGNLVDQIPQ